MPITQLSPSLAICNRPIQAELLPHLKAAGWEQVLAVPFSAGWLPARLGEGEGSSHPLGCAFSQLGCVIPSDSSMQSEAGSFAAADA